MEKSGITNGIVHARILKFIIEKGFAPDINQLAHLLHLSQAETLTALQELQAYHGVVLHPNHSKIWVIHPFSLAPTNFLVSCADGEWWGNCAWCSLGVAALLKRDVTITTTLGADGKQVRIPIQNGQVMESDYVVHFPIPMKHAWDNVIYTCSTMLLFEHEGQVDHWCQKHGIPKGDVQPILKIWGFAQVWYGNHLNPEWTKWTTAEAHQIFERFGLVHDIWKLETSNARF